MRQEGYKYSFNPSACKECAGKCCTGESGFIYIDAKEIEGIVTFLDIDKSIFLNMFTITNGSRVSLKEKIFEDSYDCIFFDREVMGCSIYEARPIQCRTFPFWGYFKNQIDELKEECKGVSCV
ncbi:MAG: YkgJ family cysteine cluster protein [Helicobacteraceae bacterium]|nr:YkgJ family cysteine cluster protein [Helicobacteraceae bacterium]